MRACATCAEFEQLLEKTSTDYWDVVLRRSDGVESERMTRLRASKRAMDEALERYKQHRESAHSVAASSAK
jgi:glutaredoxin-related protein